MIKFNNINRINTVIKERERERGFKHINGNFLDRLFVKNVVTYFFNLGTLSCEPKLKIFANVVPKEKNNQISAITF